MDKDTILKQLKSVPNYSFFMIRGTEMAKDLKDLLKDDETIQGFTEIFEKNIGMVFSNNARNGLRSYLVITDKNLYFIRRGRLNLNLITGLDKTLVIPLRDVVKITLDKSQNVSKILHPIDVRIYTNADNYEYVAYKDFLEKIPENIKPKIVDNYTEGGMVHRTPSMESKRNTRMCPKCGSPVESDSKFCTVCGEKIPEKKEVRCKVCGYELEEGAKFCTNCGKPVVIEEVEEKLRCVDCGYELEEGAKFCPNCGKPVMEEVVEVAEEKEELRCEECGCALEEGTKFCPNCGKPVVIEEVEEKLRCVDCGYELEEGAKFCLNCGKKVEEEKEEVLRCKECGYELEEGTKFCPNCGKETKEEK
ncbi:zinc ribbon domain-containing protein [Dorea amylophila]|uniref:zinc ribbon domain-containing protein n=1 Tax=Dorea amylophila TaxID=2981789 RepID=UPI0022E53E35|nr:zinc ribbon domain-containing protein [Dorea amylophila]